MESLCVLQNRKYVYYESKESPFVELLGAYGFERDTRHTFLMYILQEAVYFGMDGGTKSP